jgi:hypothetical protein
MARFHHLEVYQLSYRFSRMMYQTKIKLPKSMKNDLGQMAFQSALKVTRGIVIANGSLDKTKILNQVFLEIDVLWQFLRMMFDFKGISKASLKSYLVFYQIYLSRFKNGLNGQKINKRKATQKRARQNKLDFDL